MVLHRKGHRELKQLGLQFPTLGYPQLPEVHHELLLGRPDDRDGRVRRPACPEQYRAAHCLLHHVPGRLLLLDNNWFSQLPAQLACKMGEFTKYPRIPKTKH